MSETAGRSSRGRVLVVLDDSPFGRETLEAAAGFAAELRAELCGLFVENIDLLRLAGLPFAQEVGYSGASRRLDVAMMERTLRARAAQARRTLAETARRQQLKWSFEVSRGEVVRVTMAAAAEAETLIIGCESRQARFAVRVDPRRPPAQTQPMLAVYETAPAAKRALLIVAQLAQRQRAPLVVLLADDPSTDAGQLRKEAAALLAQQGFPPARHGGRVGNVAELAAVARQQHGKALLLCRDSRLLSEDAIVTFIDQLDCPVGLL